MGKLVAYSGFSSTNYLEQPYNPDLDFGTGDFCIMGWIRDWGKDARLVCLGDPNAGTQRWWIYASPSEGYIWVPGHNTYMTNSFSAGRFAFFAFFRKGGVAHIYIDGKLERQFNHDFDITAATGETWRVGNSHQYGGANIDIALLRISATAPTPEQIKRIYEDEKVLFQENAQATLYGTSDAVTALAHDPVTDLLHVGSSDGRSVFQGLRRVDNTTTPVNTAISAVGGMIAED